MGYGFSPSVSRQTHRSLQPVELWVIHLGCLSHWFVLVHDSGPRKLTHCISGELRETKPQRVRGQVSESGLETWL